MGDKSLSDKLSEYEQLSSGTKDVPEAGAGHYLARGALSGISALADALPNLYNLGKVAVGGVAKLAGREDLMPDVGNANPVAAFLHRERRDGGEVVGPGKNVQESGGNSAGDDERGGSLGEQGVSHGFPVSSVQQ